jgi:hypothetical protein
MAVRLPALCAGRHFPTGRFLVLISLRGWVNLRAIVRLGGLGKLKKSTSSGLEPATFRLVTQCLNQLRYRVPVTYIKNHTISWNLDVILMRAKQPILFPSRSWILTVVRIPLLYDKFCLSLLFPNWIWHLHFVHRILTKRSLRRFEVVIRRKDGIKSLVSTINDKRIYSH